MVQALGQGSGEARPGQRLVVSAGHGGESRGRAGGAARTARGNQPAAGGMAAQPSGDYGYTGLTTEIGVEECVGVKGVRHRPVLMQVAGGVPAAPSGCGEHGSLATAEGGQRRVRIHRLMGLCSGRSWLSASLL